MKYAKVVEGVFKSRPNRFIANVEINGKNTIVHVKNTGRCKELLQTNAKVYLEKTENKNRKTPYDLIAVEKKTPRGNILVNMDSMVPNKVVYEWILNNKCQFPEILYLKREYTYENSRFDFYIEYRGLGKKKKEKDKIHKMFLEVKGVTLENEGHASFPDAPTERGVKHLKELTKILEEKHRDGGTPYECSVFFLIQMKGCHDFGPDTSIHPEFGNALLEAQKAGVKIFVYDSIVSKDSIVTDKVIPFALGNL